MSTPAPSQSQQSVPTVADDGVPTECAVFSVESDLGHFRRVASVDAKTTYRVPPRTTLAGLMAAIVGRDRDSYYDVFQPDNSALAITVDFEVKTLSHTKHDVGTNPDETFESAGGTGQKSPKVYYPDTMTHRQLDSYEYLIDPKYTVYAAVEDTEFWTDLVSHLDAGTSIYPPSMGASELLASIKYHGCLTPKRLDPDEPIEIDSVVPNANDYIIPTGTPAQYEHVPAFMEANDTGRRTTAFADYAFTDSPDDTLTVRPDEITPVDIDGTTVIFH
ncbi:type I-B CRISPR-associated protein Cas5b [Natrinema sp. 1APR25-10V2]|uniref:type I-B CRISPR-associated protein Cas5b n=1 Tax=Natrinema sp. 1APR25-10V2 TaxID=2951081 RepID=UPI0028750197|nr:type I-B CRISPR-associated protein Cas5b [Natrinema sp. 1APR25-10V2]MDS0474041.1 type I-B CRISPR-associated protein Cas5b [Natrinema sp. 1APR25-10V2]